MGIELAMIRPPRCLLVNLATSESMECLFNPTGLTEKIQVNWSRQVVPGLSHQVLQFQSTGNRRLSSVEFYLDQLFAADQPGDFDVLAFRTFVRALTVPESHGSPPRVLFVWPNVLTIEAVVADVTFNYRQIAVDGRVLIYTATLTFEEILDTRVTSATLREGV